MDILGKFRSSKADDSRYRLLIEAIEDYALYTLDRTGIVTSWNSGAQRFNGYSADEVVGEHFSRFYTEEDQKSGAPAQALEAAARDGRFENEGWRVRKDDTHFWAFVVVDPIRNRSGEIIGFSHITRDLTERKAAEENLWRSEAQFRLLVQGASDYAMSINPMQSAHASPRCRARLKWTRLRSRLQQRGASVSAGCTALAGSEGKRNGNYKHGARSKEAIQLRKLIKSLR
jgi:PAS domain S-box-containing protein